MSIDTGNLTTKSRNCILNRINIFTFIFTIFIQIIINYLDYENQIVPFFSATVFSLFMARIGMGMSREGFRVDVVRKGMGEGEGEKEGGIQSYEVRYVEIQKESFVGIGDSIVGFVRDFMQNFVTFAIVIAVQVGIRYTFWKTAQHLLHQQYTLTSETLNQIFTTLQQKNIPQQNTDLYYLSFLSQFQNISKQTMNKIYSLSFQIVAIMVINFIVNFGIVCGKFVVFGGIQRREYLGRMREGREGREGMGVGIGLGDAWRYFGKLGVLATYFRLCLRMVWIFFFLNSFQPYFYVCFGFFFRKVMEPNFKLFIIQNKILQLKSKQNQLQQPNIPQNQPQTKHQQKHSKNTIVSSYGLTFNNNKEVQTVLEDDGEKESLISRKIGVDVGVNAGRDVFMGDFREMQLEQNVGQNNNKPDNLSKQIYSILKNQQKLEQKSPVLYKLLKNIEKTQKNNQRSHPQRQSQLRKRRDIEQGNRKIQKLVYRPAYNDVIEVDRF